MGMIKMEKSLLSGMCHIKLKKTSLLWPVMRSLPTDTTVLLTTATHIYKTCQKFQDRCSRPHLYRKQRATSKAQLEHRKHMYLTICLIIKCHNLYTYKLLFGQLPVPSYFLCTLVLTQVSSRAMKPIVPINVTRFASQLYANLWIHT